VVSAKNCLKLVAPICGSAILCRYVSTSLGPVFILVTGGWLDDDTPIVFHLLLLRWLLCRILFLPLFHISCYFSTEMFSEGWEFPLPFFPLCFLPRCSCTFS
jgi:hypothetical protein